jgi:ATP/maltotriose-dependent transcriptional regulator MalT/DNA-binding SARP family transcriptional activator
MSDDRSAGSPVAPAGKVLPPQATGVWIDRPRLDALLDTATARRLTLVTGSAGCGKTSTLAAWAHLHRTAWYTLDAGDRALATLARGLLDALRLRVPGLPGDLLVAMVGTLGPEAALDEEERARTGAGTLADALRQHLLGRLVLVLDDLDELGAQGPAIAFVEALCRQGPRDLHLVLAGRGAPPFPVERLRGRGEVAEIGAADLAFDEAEVGRLTEAAIGDPQDAAALAADIAATTSGWPATACLAVDALAGLRPADRPAAIARLRGRAGSLHRYLVTEILDAEPPAVRQLLRAVAPLPAFDVDLCKALGHADADVLAAALARRGGLVEPADQPGWLRLTALARDAVGAELDDDPGARAALLRSALAVLEARGDARLALLLCEAGGERRVAARILERDGALLIAGGQAELVARACAAVPADIRTPVLDQVHGEALQVMGAWDDALACFTRVTGHATQVPAGLAWRLGVIHYFRGELDDALAAFATADPVAAAATPADDALLQAWWASALWRKGDAAGCRDRATAAFAAAQRAHDDRALAAAHTALALVAALEGDRRGNDAHYLQALDAARRCGDVLQVIRIRTNRASHFLDEGFYEQALAEAEIAVGLAGPAGFATFHALALNNRGEAALNLGRLEEAIADFRAALAIEQRVGARTAGYPLLGLASVAHLRGDLTQARAAYREALDLAAAVDDVQLLVPALAGLARCLAEEDPDAAGEAADRAAAYGQGMGYAQALLAAGWVAVATGDTERAAASLAEVEAVAADRRDRPAMAEALELRARVHPDAAVPVLEEAVGLWQDVGNPVRRAQAERRLALARGGVEGRAGVAQADALLRRLGVRAHIDGAAGVDVEIGSLGGFRVSVDGRPLGPAAWQSRKARDLLKILVSRRGRPAPREALAELLWPDEDPDRVGNRLSVALSTVRGVLDPQRRRPSDWYVAGDKTTVTLDLTHVWVDLEHFLDGAERGLRLRAAGRHEEATELLTAAEALYGGDFLEEDLYEEWAVAPREEARAGYVSVARALAEAASADGDHDRAVRLSLRILERDPYDEPAHLALIGTMTRAGRHGEARRHYRAYESRMAEIGVESSPFPHA